MRSLGYLNGVLTVLAVLLALQLWVSIGKAPVTESAAVAQVGKGIPDVGAQNQEIIDQLKKLNVQLDAINGLLQSGKVRVKLDGGKSE